MKPLKVGVLALQGAFLEHRRALAELGCDSVEVRLPEHLKGLDGLIIPGGESTTIGKLLGKYNLLQPIIARGQAGMPIMGTCAGMVLLAKEIVGSEQPRLGLMDITILRNAFGRQVDSFEAELEIDEIGTPGFHAVFIRAPYVCETEPSVKVMAYFQDKAVLVRQGVFLATAFHPELTADSRLHSYFIKMIEEVTGGAITS